MSEVKQLNTVVKNTILLLSVDQLKGKTFSIGNYQRGYKWGKKEILELLNDINSYDHANGIYCLQPLILKPKSDDTEVIQLEKNDYKIFCDNEVIDGQQRTTTLFIILKYLNHLGLVDQDYLFDINYQTRERSGKFLQNHLHEIFELNIDSISENELQEKRYDNVASVNALWKTFIETQDEFDNVDIYHFFIVACYTRKWIQSILAMKEKRQIFLDQFLKSVKVIWYSLDDSKDSQRVIDVFLNNNKGKIGLTTSELIKALFILNIKNREIQSLSDLQINQFAIEWDNVEKKLQDDNFWYFLQPNSDLYKNGTRIDYLFDLYIKKGKNDDEFYAYRVYESKFNENIDLSIQWDNIIQLYTKLVDWYNDSLIYHYLGFITISKISSLSGVIKDASGKSKEKLRVHLCGLIEKHFLKKYKDENNEEFFVYSLENLSYKTFYFETQKVLFLYNVLYYTTNMAKHKFPFELYVKEKWSIEHIIPQNPKGINSFDEYKQWYVELLGYNESDSYAEILNTLNSFTSLEEINAEKDLKQKLDKIAEEFEDTTHKIDNLLLLDRNTNSALGNNLYKDKRVKILRFDKNGKNDKEVPVFIPTETMNAFNKTFGDKINIASWSREDGAKYRDAIAERLVSFLPKLK